jgi:hypothetical protein
MILSAAARPEARDDRGALLTSRHPVYAAGEPIDLTLWIKAARGPLRLGMEARDERGQLVSERAGGGRGLVAEVVCLAAPGVNTLATVPDLRKWFHLDRAGDYALTLVTAPHAPNRVVCSNVMGVSIRDQAKSELIPLSRVWALDMPGTRPMVRSQKGDPPVYEAPEGRLVDEIRAALSAHGPGLPPDAGPGFAVRGQGLDALRAAHAVLVERHARPAAFRAGEPVSLVFYAREFNYYTHLEGVERRGPDVQITYRFVPHETKELTSHLALIPLPAGTAVPARVEVKPVIDTETADLDWGHWPHRVVCRSFRLDRGEKG